MHHVYYIAAQKKSGFWKSQMPKEGTQFKFRNIEIEIDEKIGKTILSKKDFFRRAKTLL